MYASEKLKEKFKVQIWGKIKVSSRLPNYITFLDQFWDFWRIIDHKIRGWNVEKILLVYSFNIHYHKNFYELSWKISV